MLGPFHLLFLCSFEATDSLEINGMNVNHRLASATISVSFLLSVSCAVRAVENAEDILAQTHVQGGLVVHLGCGDGKLTAELKAGTRYLVHGLDANAENVTKARNYIEARGIVSGVSIMKWSGGRLPYADNMVNLLVAKRLANVTMDEVLRVLTPKGVAWIDGRQTIKPWPAGIDEWTHWLHAADGNAVAQDTVAGPPRRMQWIAGPLWSRHHNTVPSTSSMVSAGGRLFYIVDEAPAGMGGSVPDKWTLVARDAFNGIPLWKRPMPEWGWKTWSTDWKSRFTVPTQLPRRLVAVDNRVFVTLAFNAPLTELDAATGRVVRVFEHTEWTDEILYVDGRLILAVNHDRQRPGLAAAKRRGEEDQPPVRKSVAAFDASSGKLLWKQGEYVGVRSKTGSMDRISHLSMCVDDGHVFFVDRDRIVCLDLKTGRESWNVARPQVPEHKMRYNIRITDMITLVAHGGRVYFAQLDPDRAIDWREIRGRLHALSAETGVEEWNRPCASWGWGHPADVFVVGGLVWAHDYQGGPRSSREGRPRNATDLAAGKSWVGSRGAQIVGIDPATGEVRRTLSSFEAFDNGHHHRCYRNKATSRYLMTSFRGLEFLPFDGAPTTLNHWVRSTCRLGAIPCNGLVYTGPHPCDCYISSKLNGYLALAPSTDDHGDADPAIAAPSARAVVNTDSSQPSGKNRITRGPAFTWSCDQPFLPNAVEDWSTYRHDSQRSGSTTASLDAQLTAGWTADVGTRPSACVAAGDRVFVSAVDAHRIVALDIDDGRRRWAFTADGPMDTPPTVSSDRAYFGSADGHVYCVRLSDGKLAWRFRVAPEERLVGAFGHVESAWPVHGAVLVRNGVVYCSAGRSTLLDNGIFAVALDALSGKVVTQQHLITPHNVKVDSGRDPKKQSGLLSDILVEQDDVVYMRRQRLFPVPEVGSHDDASTQGEPLRATGGLLDDSWFSRTRWYLGGRPVAEYCVFDADAVYGVAARSGLNVNGGFITPGTNGYELFSALRSGKKRWSIRVPVRVTSMVLAGETLFAAGTPDRIDPNDAWAAYEGKRGGQLLALSAKDGTIKARYKLDVAPTYDGLAVARGRILVSTVDGTIRCFQGKKGS